MTGKLCNENELVASHTNFLKPFRKTEGKGLRMSKNSRQDGSKLLLSTNFGSYMDLQALPHKQFNKEISLYCQKEL